MYRCDICNEVTPPGMTRIRVVMVTRVRTYSTEQSASVGSEIVKESNLCKSCKAIYDVEHPKFDTVLQEPSAEYPMGERLRFG